ncbi:MAG: HAMP domain-containing histidine kinase, partial [Deltaproteobacteria bacterium]|nr:HAMP domain-containing histidine kinase [Deltaproteobacteria bacterium]
LSLAFIGSHIGGVAHNVTTPLSAIAGRMELLQMRLSKIHPAEGDEASHAALEKCFHDLEVIGQCCSRIDDILKNCSRTSQAALKNQAAELQLDMLLQSVLAFLNADMEFKHNTQKAYEFQENIPPFTADPVSFSLAFLELLYNARSAMLNASEKRLTVAISAADGCIEICFRDTGCGIAPHSRQDLLALLQEPPSGGDGPCSESGLQRVGRLMRPYNATFDIQSAPGDTLFKIRIPVA